MVLSKKPGTWFLRGLNGVSSTVKLTEDVKMGALDSEASRRSNKGSSMSVGSETKLCEVGTDVELEEEKVLKSRGEDKSVVNRR